ASPTGDAAPPRCCLFKKRTVVVSPPPPPPCYYPPPPVFLPPPPIAVGPAPIPFQPGPQLSPAPIPIPAPTPGAAPGQVLTMQEFAASFQAVPGTHQVNVIHPVTGNPVLVRFTLPAGSPRRVQAGRRDVEFDYGRSAVEIRFEKDGTVKVDY